MSTDDINAPLVEQISLIRTSNNLLWMDLLRLALIHAPEPAKHLLREINRNDKAISKLLEKIAND